MVNKLSDLRYHNKCNNKELVWNVITIDCDKIVYNNLLEKNGYVWNEVKSLLKKSKDIDFETFEDKVDHIIMYQYWSRFEYEHVITTFPPHITLEGIDRLLKERDEDIKLYGKCRFVQAPLDVAEKVDVYMQVQLNWTAFITYLWENKEKIYKPRKPKVVK